MRLTLIISLLISSLSAQIKDGNDQPVSIASFPSEQHKESIQLLSGRGLLFTDAVKINGQEVGVFLIDTGSNVSIIDANLLQEMNITESFQGLSEVTDIRKFRFHRLKDIQIGNFKVKNHFIYAGKVSANYPKFKQPVIGVIGGDILGKVPFTLNLNNFTLTFYKREVFNPIGESSKLTVKNKLLNLGFFSKANPQAGVPVIKAKLNKSITEDFLLDTAEADEVILRSETAIRNKQLAGSYKLPNIIRKPGSSLLQFNALINHIEIPGLALANKSKFSYILFPREGYINQESQLGYKVFKNTIISFDYAQEKIWLTKFPQPQKYHDKTDFADLNALARAVQIGDSKTVENLIEKAEGLNFKGLKGETLMMLAVEGKNSYIMDLLIKALPMQINAYNHAGVTALMRAAAANQVLMVDSLISAKAHINRPDIDGMTALHYSIMGGSLVVMEKMIKADADINLPMKSGMRPLSLAAAEGNKQLFLSLLEAGADLSFIDKVGRTILHMASFGNNPEILEAIYQHKNSPAIDSPSEDGMSPLMIAVKHQKLNSVRSLLKKGAAVKAMNPKDFTTALDLAYKSKNDQLIKLIEDVWEK
ncbi:MAG: ankyrin repeat domain-containing protein [Lentisphaerales bacterium]|nr:ankyrin repeat domain-containing protein [Lentisphaerales bacterium]